MTIVEMRVNIDCPGCESKIRKSLQKLDGVDNVDIDMIMQKVTVTGYVDQEKVLRRARRNGRHAELWPFPYNPEYHDFNQHYADQIQYHHQSSPTAYSITEIPSSYNYYEHGYNGHDHGYYQQPVYSTIIDEQTSEYFSDENSNACSIM